MPDPLTQVYGRYFHVVRDPSRLAAGHPLRLSRTDLCMRDSRECPALLRTDCEQPLLSVAGAHHSTWNLEHRDCDKYPHWKQTAAIPANVVLVRSRLRYHLLPQSLGLLGRDKTDSPLIPPTPIL